MASAKDIKTLVVTTTPQMHCANCENKIKNNLRFEKGVKKIDTNVAAQTVTIEYDADKTKAEDLVTEVGDPENGIAAGTPFEELPDDWACPLCGLGKDVFEVEE